MNEICVVHLVRAYNGIAPLRNFLESYKLNPGGIEHDLLILFKGFENVAQLNECRLELESFKYQELHLPDIGFDINVYFEVLHFFEYKYYCFLNSFSIVLDSEWLIKMYRHISIDVVGMVGATASYQSLYMDFSWKDLLSNSVANYNNLRIRKYKLSKLYLILRYIVNEFRFKPYFSPFPNYHIRSNVFMFSQDVMQKIVCPNIRNKIDAYKFESGKNSITKQVEALGKLVLIVGRDGNSYEKYDWWKSNTFWRCAQENLLVSDNQTRMYLNSDLETKAYYSYSAWGLNSYPLSKFV